MKVRKLIGKRIRHEAEGINVVGDVEAVVSANVNEPTSEAHVSSRRRTRIVQRGGRAETGESPDEEGGRDEPSRP